MEVFPRASGPGCTPALYDAIANPLLGFGLTDRFALAFVLRTLSGLLAFGALRSLVRTPAPWLQDLGARRWSLQLLTLTGVLPYSAVRTSSENLSAKRAPFAGEPRRYNLVHCPSTGFTWEDLNHAWRDCRTTVFVPAGSRLS